MQSLPKVIVPRAIIATLPRKGIRRFEERSMYRAQRADLRQCCRNLKSTADIRAPIRSNIPKSNMINDLPFGHSGQRHVVVLGEELV